jgi:hypothetical protein
MSVPCLRQALGKARGPAKLVELDRGGEAVAWPPAVAAARVVGRGKSIERAITKSIDTAATNRHERQHSEGVGARHGARRAGRRSAGRRPNLMTLVTQGWHAPDCRVLGYGAQGPLQDRCARRAGGGLELPASFGASHRALVVGTHTKR